MQSGSTLGTWRLIVRRQHRERGARVDTIPCASFETEVIEAVAGWLPDDIVEVTGSLRRRWWGSEGAKSSGYEVEVRSARCLERKVTTILTGDEGVPVPAPPRSVHSLLHTGEGSAGQGEKGQDENPQLTLVRPGLTSDGPDPTPVEPGLASAGLDPAPIRPGLTSPRPGPASAEHGDLALARPDLAPEGERMPIPQTAKVLAPDRPQVSCPTTRAGVFSGVTG